MLIGLRKYFSRLLFKKGKRNNFFSLSNSYPKCVKTHIIGSNNIIELHHDVILDNCKIKIIGSNNTIKIFDKTRLNNSVIWIEGNKNCLLIGKNCTIHDNTEIALSESTNIEIADNCLISKNCQLRTSDMHSIIQNGERTNPASDIKIGFHNWICQNVIILKGVTTKSDSIIGAGTIISKPINESNVLVCGNPSKIIKKNISWKREIK